MNKKIWLTIFKLQPTQCPTCRVPILVRDVIEHDERYLLLTGVELNPGSTAPEDDFIFIYDMQEQKTISGSQDLRVSKDTLKATIAEYEMSFNE